MNKTIRIILIVLTLISGLWVIYYFPFNFDFSSVAKFAWSMLPISVCFHFANLFIGPLGIIKKLDHNSIENRVNQKLFLAYIMIGIALIPAVCSFAMIILFAIFITDIKGIEEVAQIEYLKMISLSAYSGIALLHLIYWKKKNNERHRK